MGEGEEGKEEGKEEKGFARGHCYVLIINERLCVIIIRELI